MSDTASGIDCKTERAMGMNRINRITLVLSGLLVVQLGLAVLLRFGEVKYQPVEPTANLITCDLDTISRLTIEESGRAIGAKKTTLVVQKDKNVWSLPGYYGVPASIHSINNLYESLKLMKKDKPAKSFLTARAKKKRKRL